MSEQQQSNSGPEWVPYQPPPPSGSERVWMAIRRFAFPVLLLLFVGGMGALLYVSSEMGPGTPSWRELVGLETSSSPTAPSGRRATGASDTAESDPTDVLDLRLDEDSSNNGPLGSGYANLSVFSEPSDATVLVDGDTIGTTPLNRYPIRSGVYIITVERDSFFSADTVAVLRNNQAPTYAVTLNPRPTLPDDEDDPAPTLDETQTAEAEPSSSADEAPASEPPTSEPEPEPEPEPTTGTLALTSTPSEARVTLDGEAVGTTPLTLEDLAAGTHEVVFAREGYEDERMDVAVTAGEERTVQAALTPQMGRLRVLAQPWGSIYIDGELRERNADVWFETSIPPGTHEVAAVHPALGRQTRTVTIEPGGQFSLVIDLRNPPPLDESSDTTQSDADAGR